MQKQHVYNKESTRIFDDAEGIKELFYQRSKELPDIDEQIQVMLDYFEGKVVTYNEEKSVDKRGATKDDGVWTEIQAYGHIPEIVTDTGKEYKE